MYQKSYISVDMMQDTVWVQSGALLPSGDHWVIHSLPNSSLMLHCSYWLLLKRHLKFIFNLLTQLTFVHFVLEQFVLRYSRDVFTCNRPRILMGSAPTKLGRDWNVHGKKQPLRFLSDLFYFHTESNLMVWVISCTVTIYRVMRKFPQKRDVTMGLIVFEWAFY